MYRNILVLLISAFSLSVFALTDPDIINKKTFARPIRDVSLIYTPEGYYPNSFSVFVGETVRLYLTSTTQQPGCMLLSEKDVFMSAQKGKVSEAEVYFEKAGVYKYYCPKGNVSGKLTVLERPQDSIQREKIKINREISSKKNKVIFWRPREDEVN